MGYLRELTVEEYFKLLEQHDARRIRGYKKLDDNVTIPVKRRVHTTKSMTIFFNRLPRDKWVRLQDYTEELDIQLSTIRMHFYNYVERYNVVYGSDRQLGIFIHSTY